MSGRLFTRTETPRPRRETPASRPPASQARRGERERGGRGGALLVAVPLLVACLEGCSKNSAAVAPAQAIAVAAASDLSFAFKEVGQAYEKKTGQPVVFSFGSTGLLERQIAEGGPFDVFAAANVSYADDAVAAGACAGDSKAIYAVGRVVLYTTSEAAFRPKSLADLTSPQVTKIAIANPEHAPYGKAAKQALERAGVWPQVQSRIVYGENVQQTLQFAQSGNAEVAIVALSLALATPGAYTEVPAELHDRIDQALVVCKNGKAGSDAGKRFVAYVQSPEGRAIMRRMGFLLPGETLAKQ
jgi:molybdate transport system substrate-binding protein